MASAPGIPTGGYSKATPDERRLRAVSDGYEPGSTFKVVTIGAALQEGRVTPDTTFTVPYSMSLFDREITDADTTAPRPCPSRTSSPSRRTSAPSRSPARGSARRR